ncbi:MAG: flippase [Flavobacteriales bacterium]|nr:flippase [Flavobacteriales bacterium]
MTSLRKRSLSGVVWTFAQQFGGQLINFFISIVLARILMPEEFGLIGMIAIVIAVGTSLMEAGMTQSLIRTPNPDNADYSTVFYVNLFVSLFVYLIIYLFAPLIASFYDESILTELLRFLGLSIIIGAFSSVQRTKLTKEMNFKVQFAIQLPSLIISGIIGVTMAYLGYGVWSLVYMQLARSFISSLQFWIYSSWSPKLIFNTQRLKYHFNFGYKLTISGLINTLYGNMYHVIIGKYFSTADLGFYTRADSTKQLPVSNISTAINKVTYPMFAEIKDNNERLKNAYTLVMQQVLFWVSPILIGAAVIAEPLFRLVFTEKWLPAVPMFQILCVVGILYPINAYNLSVLNVKGRSDLFLKLEIIKKSYTIIGVLLVIPFGIYALLYFQIATSIIGFFINSFYSGKFIDFPITDQLKKISPIFIVTLIMGGCCYLLDKFMLVSELHDSYRLVFVSTLGGFVYFSISKMANLAPLNEFLSMIKKSK